MSAISLLQKNSITETGFILEISLTSQKYAFFSYLFVSKPKILGDFDILWLGRVPSVTQLLSEFQQEFTVKKQMASPNDSLVGGRMAFTKKVETISVPTNFLAHGRTMVQRKFQPFRILSTNDNN